MARIAVTGAAGTVGRQTLDALSDHEVTPITHRDHEDIDSVVLELEDRPGVEEALEGHDAVVHLAAASSTDSSWEAALHTNIDGTRNVYEAAVTADVDRIVFASTNHVTHMYNIAEPGRTPTLGATPRVVHADDPPRPDSYYGISKVAGEALGTFYADTYGIEVINLRIGWLLSRDELASRQQNPDEEARYARAMWLSPRDWRHLVRRALSVPLRGNSCTVNAISRNDERYLSLTEAAQHLGYRPRDNASETLDLD
jgi:L-arabinose 1-dehydrogenase [NAD(P)+]